ncbi:MAG: helix-turn-helix domain-containing protein [bacterium]
MEDKKKHILESARKFFFRYGFKKTSLDEVAEDAGIAKGTIYNYFRNKEDLFICNVRANLEVLWQELELEMQQFRKADEKLLHSTLALIRHHRRIVSEYAMSRGVLEELLQVGMNLINDMPEHDMRIMNILQEGVEQGIFRTEDHGKHAALLNQTIRMFFLRWATMDAPSAENEIRDLYHLFLNGLRT